MQAKEYTLPMGRRSSFKKKTPMKREKMVYIRPEMEVIEIVLMHILAISHELGIDSENQGDESADFGRKRDNSRGVWGDLWGD